jgi:ribosomal protein L37E
VGMTYLGVLCRRCGEHIPMVHDTPEDAKLVDVPDSTRGVPIIAFCPFCGFSARYRDDELTSKTLTKIPPPLQ